MKFSKIISETQVNKIANFKCLNIYTYIVYMIIYDYICLYMIIYDYISNDYIPSYVYAVNLDECKTCRNFVVDKYKVCRMCERDYVSSDHCCSQTSSHSP